MPQYELNLRDYIRIFRKRRVTIVLTFVCVLLASIFLKPKQTVTYSASTTIKIEERKTIAGLLTEWIVYNPGDIMQSEARFITSFPVMIQVGMQRGAISADWFLPGERDQEFSITTIKPEFVDQVNRVVGSLQGRIQTEIVTGTNMIKITASAEKAVEAMNLANEVAQAYLKENLREKNKQARHAREFIEEQLRELEKNISLSEEKLKAFSRESDQIRLAGPMEEKLVELQFKLSELLQRYTEKHPDVVRLREQIRSMESQAQGVSDKQMQYARVNREVEVNRKLYGMLKEKLEEAKISEREKVSDVTVVDPAVIPAAPVAAGNRLKVVVGAFLGLIMGIAFAFIVETLDTSIGTIEDVENVIKLPVLGVVPPIESEIAQQRGLFSRWRSRVSHERKSDKEERLIHLYAHFQPHSPTTEAFRNIHTNLKLSSQRKVILVTSSGPGEGKSSVVCNLGLVMAQIGLRVLLVSTDLRRPIMAKMFGVKREPGLSEIVLGTARLEDGLRNITDILLGDIGLEDIRKTPGIENIWILPSGHLPYNPVELIESKSMADIIARLKQQFDVVLFDSPPVLPVTDASLLAPKVDAVVVVYEIGRTGREGLMRTKVQLESVGAKIAGVVLNHTQPQTEAITAYPYYQKYKYYGKDVAAASAPGKPKA